MNYFLQSNLNKIYFAFLFLLFLTSPIFAQSTILVDFGSDASSNSFGLAGWNTLIKSPNVSYSSEGPGGLLPNAGVEEFDDYQGVQGTARNFSLGERIVVTWYNTSAAETYTMNARISFDDSNAPNADGADGNWYTMRSFDDYRYSYQDIGPGETKKTVFNITDSGVHTTTGNHSVVNVNVSFEWFDADPKQYLLCDKIELYNDADIEAPNIPAGLSASAVSDGKIELNWTAPNDNTGVVEYLVYLGADVEGYTRTNSYTASLLEPSTEYTFTVTALDAAGNESGHSASASAETNAFEGDSDLFNPKGLEYIGDFTVPETFAYGGDGFEYNPDGDGGQAGAGAGDGYPGSLFISDLNIPARGLCAEITIPAPVVSASHDINDLNESSILQAAANIRPTNVNNWDYVDIWRSGFEYVAEENRLYSSWGIYYAVTDEKHSSISFCSAGDLSGSTKYGAWYIGAADALPNDKMLGDYLFRTPQSWADANTSGRPLVNGRYREGGLSGLGPTLYSFALLGAGEPPAADAALPFTTLLEYGSVAASDNYNFPNSITDYNHSDLWRDADWISGGSTSAVMIIGDKAHGDNWYGYQGEFMRHNWVICDLPYPDFYATDPNGKGWQAHDYIPMAVFYDPDDLAAVAAGAMNSYEPQPYAAKRFDESIFWRDGKLMEIVSASYDDVNERLYVTEFNGLNDGKLIIHVFDYNASLVPVELTSFTAAVKGNTAWLNWRTATETNCAGFEIQRNSFFSGEEPGSWKNIVWIASGGTTAVPQYYSYKDENLNDGIYQYRLKQIDNDGSFEYSNTVEVQAGGQLEFKLNQNYPNPANPSTVIEYEIPKNGFVSLNIYDALGREVQTLIDEFQTKGFHKIDFNASALSSGIYFYQLNFNNKTKTKTKKLMILK